MSRPMSMEEITSSETKDLVKEMIETMQANGGIGLAAPQIGILKQLAIIGIPEESTRYPEAPKTHLVVVINPEIEVIDETLQANWEGCLSVPGLRGVVKRPRKIRVSYYDLNGERNVEEIEDFLATVFQHEIDHLFGTLYVDKLFNTHQFSYVEEFQQFWQIKDDEK